MPSISTTACRSEHAWLCSVVLAGSWNRSGRHLLAPARFAVSCSVHGEEQPLKGLEPDDPETALKSPVASTRKPRLLKLLGPGLVTGASDDDPSGIATYSQA